MSFNMYNRISDPSVGILEALYDYADMNDGIIPDHIFAQIVVEYELDEDQVMKDMMETKDYFFDRLPTGFMVKLG